MQKVWQGEVEYCLSLKTPPSAVITHTHTYTHTGSAFSGIQYCIPGRLILSKPLQYLLISEHLFIRPISSSEAI